MTKMQTSSTSVDETPSLRQPKFVAIVAGQKVTVAPQPQEVNDSGKVRLGTTHVVWDWLFGKRG